VYDLDLPGYGRSQAVGAVGIDAWADNTAEFIESTFSSPVIVHGTSMGGLVALRLAEVAPQTVERLILSCCMMRYDNAARQMRQTWKLAARTAGMSAAADLTAVAGFSRSFYDRSDAERIVDELRIGMSSNAVDSFVAGTEGLEALDMSMSLSRLRAPTLLIGGSEDNMTPWQPSPSGFGFDSAIRVLPEARLEVIEGSGHYLVLERPEEAARSIREFINEKVIDSGSD
jgi:3-oxoadipate enol-lactonase